jgi:two-component system LytT family sensor kinase
MLEGMKNKKWEILLVFGCVAFYVVRRMFQEANAFDGFIYGLEARVDRNMLWLIWRELDNYSHFWNSIVPIAAGGLVFFAAWCVFHVWFFPKLKAADASAGTWVFGVLAMLLLVASVFVHNFLRLYYRELTSNISGEIFGIRVFSEFRRLYLLTDSIAVVVILCLYEALAQVFYYVKAINRKTLLAYCDEYPKAKNAPLEWYHELLKSDFSSFQGLKNTYGSASLVSDDRVVFNVLGKN